MPVTTVITLTAATKMPHALIVDLIRTAKRRGKKVTFAKSCDHLDIDTPKKDSYALFESGLDFAMLVTDKHRYLKSRHDVSEYLPRPGRDEQPGSGDQDDADWVIQVVQDGSAAIYPTDIHLTVTADGDTFRLVTDDGTAFASVPVDC